MPFQIFSQRERDVEECHRRVGRVGPEYQSSRRGRGEQRRPLRRRVGGTGACPPPLRGRSAILSPNAACTSGGPKIDSYVEISTQRRHGGITSPCRRQVGASLRRSQHMRAFQSQAFARNRRCSGTPGRRCHLTPTADPRSLVARGAAWRAPPLGLSSVWVGRHCSE